VYLESVLKIPHPCQTWAAKSYCSPTLKNSWKAIGINYYNCKTYVMGKFHGKKGRDLCCHLFPKFVKSLRKSWKETLQLCRKHYKQNYLQSVKVACKCSKIAYYFPISTKMIQQILLNWHKNTGWKGGVLLLVQKQICTASIGTNWA